MSSNVTALRPHQIVTDPRSNAARAIDIQQAPEAETHAPTLQAVGAAETRGFVLYVGLDEAKAAADGTSLTELVQELRRLTAQLAPHATTHASVALAPKGAGGRDVDVVRLALGDRQALAEREAAKRTQLGLPQDIHAAQDEVVGVTIDTTRHRILIDGESIQATYTEFELLQALVLREGRAASRDELIDVVWHEGEEERPSERTIDVHIRRLRAKLGGYSDIIRTVRGQGYRFDRHADVEVLRRPSKSPDRI